MALTKKQKKLPMALQKAILKKQKKRRENKMPQGKGTYGSKVGRPPKKMKKKKKKKK